MKTRLHIAFYILLALTVIVRFLPMDWLIGIYSPSFLGWIWVLGLLPSTVILFLILLFKDIKTGRWKDLGFHSLALLMGVALVMLHWFLFATPPAYVISG